jgi:SAM-dependent methyltransferase
MKPPLIDSRDIDIAKLAERVTPFAEKLQSHKSALSEIPWYPYPVLDNFTQLDGLLGGEHRKFLKLAGDDPVLDIGCADGDLAFFLEHLGLEAHAIDFGPTNFNRLRGARRLKEALGSSVAIHELDLDDAGPLPAARYGLVFFLGTLYHLKNPYSALERLARAARFCVLNTKVAKWTPDRKLRLMDAPVAYLLDPKECNDDSTNYWVFSELGLRRIVERSGWEIRSFVTSNNPDSDPATPAGDERAACLLESRAFPW